jgi:hypothetical protein
LGKVGVRERMRLPSPNLPLKGEEKNLFLQENPRANISFSPLPLGEAGVRAIVKLHMPDFLFEREKNPMTF